MYVIGLWDEVSYPKRKHVYSTQKGPCLNLNLGKEIHVKRLK